MGGPIIALVVQENASLRTVGASFLAIKVVWALSRAAFRKPADINDGWIRYTRAIQ